MVGSPVKISEDEGSPPSPKRSCTEKGVLKSGNGSKGKGRATANQESESLHTLIWEMLLDVLKENKEARPSTLGANPTLSGKYGLARLTSVPRNHT